MYLCVACITFPYGPKLGNFVVQRISVYCLPVHPYMGNHAENRPPLKSSKNSCFEILISELIKISKQLTERSINLFFFMFHCSPYSMLCICQYEFNFVEHVILYFLSKTYPSCFYRIEQWFDPELKRRSNHKMSVVFHKVMKK